jgi:hypothetical protein
MDEGFERGLGMSADYANLSADRLLPRDSAAAVWAPGFGSHMCQTMHGKILCGVIETPLPVYLASVGLGKQSPSAMKMLDHLDPAAVYQELLAKG